MRYCKHEIHREIPEFVPHHVPTHRKSINALYIFWEQILMGMPVGPFGPYGPNRLNEMYARKRYREHNAYVRGKMVEYERNGGVLKDKFLEYKIGEGWKPLCDFVGAKVPNGSFPHSNQKGSLVVEVGFFPRIRKIATFSGSEFWHFFV